MFLDVLMRAPRRSHTRSRITFARPQNGWLHQEGFKPLKITRKAAPTAMIVERKQLADAVYKILTENLAGKT
jgi:hypothetical protein